MCNNIPRCTRLYLYVCYPLHNVLYSIRKHDVIITYTIAFKQAVNVKASSPYHTLTIHHPQYDWFAENTSLRNQIEFGSGTKSNLGLSFQSAYGEVISGPRAIYGYTCSLCLSSSDVIRPAVTTVRIIQEENPKGN